MRAVYFIFLSINRLYFRSRVFDFSVPVNINHSGATFAFRIWLSFRLFMDVDIQMKFSISCLHAWYLFYIFSRML